MDEAELRDARDHVAAEHSRRERLREDWGYYREPEEVLDEAVGELLAEQNRLRTVVDAVRDYQQAMFGLAPGFSIEDLDAQSVQTNAAWQRVRQALDQLDVSPTGEGT